MSDETFHLYAAGLIAETDEDNFFRPVGIAARTEEDAHKLALAHCIRKYPPPTYYNHQVRINPIEESFTVTYPDGTTKKIRVDIVEIQEESEQ